MRVIQQPNDIKDITDSPRGGLICCGCFPHIRVFRRGRHWHRKAPVEETRIVMLYDNIKEEFEATLRTYTRRRRHGSMYYRHLLFAIKQNGPAGLMGIEDCDELLVFGVDGVEDKSHEDVLDLFRQVKVDGQTRFSLVIRRKPMRKWIWIETSAILGPGPQPFSDDRPVVEDAEFKRLDNKYVEMTTKNRYKIHGTQRFLVISNQQVTANVAMGGGNDNTIIICKHQRYWQDNDGQVYFEAALCDESGKNYIGVSSKNEIVVKNRPEWFEMQEKSSDILFKRKDVYLAYNHDDDQVDAQTSEFLFEEIPGDVELQLTRNNCSSNDNISSGDFSQSQTDIITDVEKHSRHASVSSSGSSNSLSSSASKRSLSSRSTALSDDGELPKENPVADLCTCHITSGTHLQRSHGINAIQRFSNSVSSGHLSMHSEQINHFPIGNYTARSQDRLDTTNVCWKRKETTV